MLFCLRLMSIMCLVCFFLFVRRFISSVSFFLGVFFRMRVFVSGWFIIVCVLLMWYKILGFDVIRM